MMRTASPGILVTRRLMMRLAAAGLSLPVGRALASSVNGAAMASNAADGRPMPPLQANAASSFSGAAPAILPGQPWRFPRDFGAHPAYRTEWWYITGWLRDERPASPAAAPLYGFQITFFRSRVDTAADNPSRFAARQLIFAHAALTDVAAGRLQHDQRIARAGFGLAEAAQDDTHLLLRDWHLKRRGPVDASVYDSRVAGRGFSLDLRFTQTQPLLLQGDAGYSRKGPRPAQVSRYYSQPQLAAQGRIQWQGRAMRLAGRAWLDHECGETLLDKDAVGWDWLGMNLDDGTALTAFRLRRRDGSVLWSGGSWRPAGQPARIFTHGQVHLQPGRAWASPATGARYPVHWLVETPVGRHEVRALVDAQELDSRLSTGGIYWEGLSELRDGSGRRVGLGYLEMTGYAGELTL